MSCQRIVRLYRWLMLRVMPGIVVVGDFLSGWETQVGFQIDDTFFKHMPVYRFPSIWKHFQASHEKCPTLKVPSNAKEIKCDGATCMTVCRKGFIPRGRRRITCLEDEQNKGIFKWDFKQLTACITCDPALPQFDDDRIIRKCKINKKDGSTFGKSDIWQNNRVLRFCWGRYIVKNIRNCNK